jgi:hypothetical protein
MFGDEADKETDDGDAPYHDRDGSDSSSPPAASAHARQPPARQQADASDSSSDEGEGWYEKAGRLAASALSAAARHLSSGTGTDFMQFTDEDIDLDGLRGRGRPLGSKDRRGPDGTTGSGKKRGRPLGSKDTRERIRSGKPLGRPRKHPKPDPAMVIYNSDSEASASDRVLSVLSGEPIKRKRGRPRIHPVKEKSDVPRKRGRPRKHPLPDPALADSTEPRKRGRPPGSKTVNRNVKKSKDENKEEGKETGEEELHRLLQEAESVSE